MVRRPGEKLGFGLRFEGGGRASECVRRLFIQCCSPESPAARAACSWGGIVEGDQILAIGGHQVSSLTRLDCVKALKDSPVSVNMRIRHYFSPDPLSSLQSSSSYNLLAAEKKFSTLPKQTREKTSQTSPKKPLRTSTTSKKTGGVKLLSSQSLRMSSSVPSLAPQAKSSGDTDGKVTLHPTQHL